jgi:hypothetical protein
VLRFTSYCIINLQAVKLTNLLLLLLLLLIAYPPPYITQALVLLA